MYTLLGERNVVFDRIRFANRTSASDGEGEGRKKKAQAVCVRYLCSSPLRIFEWGRKYWTICNVCSTPLRAESLCILLDCSLLYHSTFAYSTHILMLNVCMLYIRCTHTLIRWSLLKAQWLPSMSVIRYDIRRRRRRKRERVISIWCVILLYLFFSFISSCSFLFISYSIQINQRNRLEKL